MYGPSSSLRAQRTKSGSELALYLPREAKSSSGLSAAHDPMISGHQPFDPSASLAIWSKEPVNWDLYFNPTRKQKFWAPGPERPNGRTKIILSSVERNAIFIANSSAERPNPSLPNRTPSFNPFIPLQENGWDLSLRICHTTSFAHIQMNQERNEELISSIFKPKPPMALINLLHWDSRNL
ncbi:uncharacterized protein EI90DRAFT_3288082 [Cantharellus anzutake]|uniref:uncharacterized protein n=1 Tax=Cantharellus anzutake TaxID=1750568 RepID=UPI001905276C|nr:uncharacterized protein EI90DRAFT_3288082 [Cantharellus anzutake]KAF8335039.1 hypothetical protein EI90DRAFT_3288082 [Cantharellus anzutake]